MLARSGPISWPRSAAALRIESCSYDRYSEKKDRDLTGGADHAGLWRGRYSTPIGCGRVLRKLGWHSLEEGGRALLGAPLADPRLAQRGDLVLGGDPEAFGVVTGGKAAFVAPEGLVRLPLATCRLAWRT